MTDGNCGVLPSQAIRDAINSGFVRSDLTFTADLIQPASLDLRLGDWAYRLQCSFLPGSAAVESKLPDYSMEKLDLRDGAVLEQNRPYLIPLREELHLPHWLRARTNPRSSTGRLDVFTRVVTDEGPHFDEVREGYAGRLYLEVVSRSFTIKVHAGMRLNQMRLMAGEVQCDNDQLRALDRETPIVFPMDEAREDVPISGGGLFLSVDLARRDIVGYQAKRNSRLLDLSKKNAYRPSDFWERLLPDRNRRLVLEPEQFYLLVSRERVRIPRTHAAEMAAYDPTSGELRTHYAGFFDPGFGDVQDSLQPGTPAVLEVRAHDVPFALTHGQRICRLTFEQMMAPPDRAYGADIGSSYQRQYLALGRQFEQDESAYMPPLSEPVLFPDEPLGLVPEVDSSGPPSWVDLAD